MRAKCGNVGCGGPAGCRAFDGDADRDGGAHSAWRNSDTQKLQAHAWHSRFASMFVLTVLMHRLLGGRAYVHRSPVL